MSDTTILLSAMGVFAIMIIGLALTIIEFKYGAPRRQEEAARARKKSRRDEERDDIVPANARQA